MPLVDPRIIQTLKSLIQGKPFGQVWPTRPSPPPLSKDGRTIALEILRMYVASLVFYKDEGPGKPPRPFTIPEDRFHIEWPSSPRKLTFPCIAVVHGDAEYDAIGLNSYLEEDTANRYGKGTVLQWQSEYQETLELEIWCSSKAVRRAILAGIETAMTPTESYSGLRFRMPGYYDELVVFELMGRKLYDDVDSARNRRRARLKVFMRFTVVALVNQTNFKPQGSGAVDVDEQGLPVTVTEVTADTTGLAALAQNPTD
jgi:hypothetical protein